MTTDTHPKEAALRVEIGGRPVTLGAIAKGTGMIHPLMATMFCFVATDLAIEPRGAAGRLRRAVNGSFNRISVDGDRSTSDTVLVLANGLAENRPLTRGDRRLRLFQQALDALTQRLAVMQVRDGEGATMVIDVQVRGARTRREARDGGPRGGQLPALQDRHGRPRPQLGPDRVRDRGVGGRRAGGPAGHLVR